MSKVCLGMIIKNEEFFLNRHLPVIRSSFDGLIVNDTGSSDNSKEIVRNFGGVVLESTLENDFARARNIVIEEAEKNKNIEWLFFLDADECVFKNDVEIMKNYMDEFECIFLPTLEFAYDRDHLYYGVYPDWHGRLFRLRRGYRYKNRLHEELYKGDIHSLSLDSTLKLPNCHIYHYGMTRDEKTLWLKYANYDRLLKGEDLISEVPEGVKPELKVKTIKYFGKQPV